MLDLFIGLRRVIKRRTVHIDNSVFRLHWLFTSIMLISCSLIVTSRQYVGDPIDCLQTDDIPANILNTYCWIHSTYTMPGAFDKIVGVDVPHPGIERSRGRIYEDALENELIQQEKTSNLNKTSLELSIKNNNQKIPKRNRHLFRSTKYRKYYTYYQWVCFTLFIEAIFFYLPFYLWKIWEGGLLYSITVGMQIAVVSKEEKERKRDILSEYLCNHLGHYKAYAYKYFFCELLCFANVTGQFFMLNWFFDGEFFQYGIKVIKYALHDPSLTYDPMNFIFPRMTKCTFHSYGFSGDVQRHDALCMLTLNVINEKIYIFIWFWFLLLWTLLFFVILYRIIILFFWNSRKYFLSKRCTLSDKEDLKFICEIGNIGDFFLLYMLGSNLDPLLMRDITKIIAEQFENNIKIEMQNENELKKSKNNFLNEHHHPYHLQSSAPIDDSITNQYLNPNYLNRICNPGNRDFNSVNYRNCCLNDNCLSSGSTKNRTNYQEKLFIENQQQNQTEFDHFDCVGCFNQHNCLSTKCDNNSSKQDNYFTINQQRKSINKLDTQKDNVEEEIINCCLEDNQATLAVNHCLKENSKQQKIVIDSLNKLNDEYINIDDDCKNSIRSIKSIRSINKKETKINLSVSNNQSNKSTKSNLNDDDNISNLNVDKNFNNQNIDQNLRNQMNTSRKSFSNCTNSNCCTNKSLENSEISSLANSSSGFESKLNASNSEISINGNELKVLNEQDEIHENSNQNLNKKHNNIEQNDDELIQSHRRYSQNQSATINLFSTATTNSTLNNIDSIDQISNSNYHHHHHHHEIELEQQEDNLTKECENCNRKKNSIESNSSLSSDQLDRNKDNNNLINNNKNKRIFNFRPFSLNKTKSSIKEFDYKKSKNTIFNTNLSLPSFLNRKSNDNQTNDQINLNNKRQDYQYQKAFRSTSLNIEQQQNRNFNKQTQFRSNSSKRLNYSYHQNNQIYTGLNHNNSNFNQMNNNQMNNHSNYHSNQFNNQQSTNQNYYSSNRRINKKIKDI